MLALDPKAAINPILADLNKLIRSPDPDQFSMARVSAQIERDFRAGNVSPAEYHMAKGFLAMAKREPELALQSMRNAVKLGQSDQVLQSNAMITYSSMVALEDGVALLRNWRQWFPDDKEMMWEAVMRACGFLQLELATSLVSHFEQLALNDYSPRPPLTSDYLGLCRAAALRHGLSDADLSERLKVAVDALSQKGHVTWQCSHAVLHDGSIICSLHIHADARTCAQLNFEIADALVSNFDEPGAEFISINCRPFSDLPALNPDWA